MSGGPFDPRRREEILKDIINNVKRQGGNFANGDLDKLGDMFGPRKCQSDRDREKPGWGEDERKVKSYPSSPMNEKDQ